MLGALWGVMFLNLGFPAYGPAVINAAMAKALGLHREMLGNMFSVYMIMSGLPGPLVAVSINRFGVRNTLILGSGFIIIGALLMATVVTGGWGAMLCFGLLVGTGVATGAALASQGPGGGPGTASSFTQLAMAIIVYGVSALVVGTGLIGAARRR